MKHIVTNFENTKQKSERSLLALINKTFLSDSF